MINKWSKIYIAGHKGLVGSAILRRLKSYGYKNLIVKTRKELDLSDQKKVLNFLKKTKPEFIFIAAAKVGGIYANNTYKAETMPLGFASLRNWLATRQRICLPIYLPSVPGFTGVDRLGRVKVVVLKWWGFFLGWRHAN